MKLSTKVGIQAAIGVLIAWYIMSLLPIPKSYWGPLTVIVLFASSKGQNQSRAIFRVTMTLFGGLFATLIVYYIHLPLIGNIIVLLIVTFFIFYFFSISYAWSIFFAIFIVVYLYVILINWSFQLFEWRIVENLIGAGIVFAISTLWPLKIQNRIMNELNISIQCTLSLMKEVVKTDESERTSLIRITLRSKLHQSMEILHATLKTLRYENVFKKCQLELERKVIYSLESILDKVDMIETVILVSKKNYNTEIIHNEITKTIFLLESLQKKIANYLKNSKTMKASYDRVTEDYIGKEITITVAENLITKNLLEQFISIREDLVNIDRILKKQYI